MWQKSCKARLVRFNLGKSKNTHPTKAATVGVFVVLWMFIAPRTLWADPPAGSGDGWQVIPQLTDEFEGTAIDSTKWWNYNPGWLGREPGYFSPNNVTVSDGKLHLTARVESLPNLPAGYHTYTTAAVKGKTLVKYGYFEIRCRPMKSKASSAFWFYQHTPQEWTEIDVFEVCGAGGSWNNTYNMNVHHFYSPASNTYFNNSQTWRPPFVMADEYHVYALEWNKDVIRWWVDGVVMRQLNNTHWHQPLHMNFDSETFPTWFGLPDPATLPSTFSIDYVRSWSSPTQVAWTSASQTSPSEGGTMTVTATLSSVSSVDVTVPFTVSGSASASDYTITSSPIIIPAGQTTGTATITIIGDDIQESNETVILTMGPPSNATKGEVTVHTATIPGSLSVIGSWTYNGTNSTSNTWTTAGSWSGGVIADGANSTANFILDITAARTITLGANRTIGGIAFTDIASSHNLTISGNTLAFDVTTGAPVIDVTQSDRALTIDSIIAGSDGLTKSGSGTLALSGSNTYTGATIISQGTFNVLDNTNGIKSSSSLSIAAGATVNATQINSLMPGAWTIAGTLNKTDNTGQDFYNGITLNNGTISGTTDKTDFGTYFWAGGSITANGSSNTISAARLGLGGGTANTPLSTDALSISSILGGTNASANNGSLTKNGAGTLTLTAVNRYIGATTVNAGTLLINGGTSATSAVTVNGGNLGGTGTIGGNVTVAAAGNLSPGVNAGTLNINGNLTISAMASGAGRLKFDLGALAGTNDRIVVGGTLSLGTLALDDLAVTNLGDLEAGIYTLITSTGLTGTVDGGTAPIAPGFRGKLQTTGNHLELVVTVESSPYETWAGSGVTFDSDSNNDGVDNGMAWLLGATNPSENATDKLPAASTLADNLRLTFRCLKSTHRGGMVLKIQTSSDMGLTDPWVTNEAVVPDADSISNGVVFDTTDDGDYIHVIADIPAAGTKLFVRLSAVNAP